MKRVTIKDVARKVGVTHATVSMVIHNDKRITEATRKKVLKAIEDLNYHPNQSARSLVTGITNTIAIVMRRYYSMFGLEILAGLEEGVLNTHYNLNLYSSRGDASHTNYVVEEILNERKADAVIILAVDCDSEVVEKYRREEIPLVVIDGSGKGAHQVRVNNKKGAYLATRSLIENGRRRIGLVIGSKRFSSSQKDRLAGFKKALKEGGLEFERALVKEVDDHSYSDGKKIFQNLIDLKVDSVYCAAGDWVAAGILEEAKKARVKIPRDLAVIGHDDMDIAKALDLTTISQPNGLMGQRGFELAVEAINAKTSLTPIIKTFEPELVVRATT